VGLLVSIIPSPPVGERVRVRGTTLALIVSLAITLLSGPVAADAQQAGKVPQIGFLAAVTPLQILEVRSPNEFDSTFSAVTRERAAGLLVLPDPMFFRHRTRIADLAAKHRLPWVGAEREYAEAGGLMSYAWSLAERHHRAAYFVDRILKGAKPADLPVEQPTKFELVVNLKTAKALGLTIPQAVLIRADHVIQ